MQKPQIIVTITPEADTTVTVKGAKGSSCKDLTKQLERALGATTHDANTQEMYEHGESRIVGRS
jgi:hypothetical protein